MAGPLMAAGAREARNDAAAAPLQARPCPTSSLPARTSLAAPSAACGVLGARVTWPAQCRLQSDWSLSCSSQLTLGLACIQGEGIWPACQLQLCNWPVSCLLSGLFLVLFPFFDAGTGVSAGGVPAPPGGNANPPDRARGCRQAPPRSCCLAAAAVSGQTGSAACRQV